MYKKQFEVFIIYLLAICSWSCNEEKISSRKVPVQLFRFDQAIFEIFSEKQLDSLAQSYPYFSQIYFNEVIPVFNVEQNQINFELLTEFRRDSFILYLRESCEKEFTELEKWVEILEKPMAKYMDMFGLDSIPRMYTFISGLAYQRFIFDDGGRDGVALGLDMFLGSNFPYKQIAPENPSFSQYLTRTFTKEHMSKKAFELLIDDKMPNMYGDQLLDYMIQNGKKLYILGQILQNAPDTIIMEYTNEQLTWCEEYELEIWSTFIDEGLLYENELRRINKYIFPSPNSPGMPAEAPGRTANFIGKKIVESFMRRHPQTTISELFSYTDSQNFLEESKYRPGR